MPNVTAKFKVTRITPWGYGSETSEVELTPDYAEGKNKDWADKTPSGVIRMTVRGEVVERFPLGQSFEIIFHPEDSPASL